MGGLQGAGSGDSLLPQQDLQLAAARQGFRVVPTACRPGQGVGAQEVPGVRSECCSMPGLQAPQPSILSATTELATAHACGQSPMLTNELLRDEHAGHRPAGRDPGK